MDRPPILTVFGSCRVVTPCSILQSRGQVRMNQANIFGFVHNAPEILQQFELVCGSARAPTRLRGFLNMPTLWKAPEAIPAAALDEEFDRRFAETDLFVVEVSSIRVLQFKAFFLQIHRTREIVTAGGAPVAWWEKLVRTGHKDFQLVEDQLSDPVHREVLRALVSYEQDTHEVERSVLKVARFLKKPVLLVSTFNTDYNGKPVPQRTILQEALTRTAAEPNCAFFDPTKPVLEAGLKDAIQDLGHYKPDFEPVIADLLLQAVEQRLSHLRAANAATA